MPKPEVHTASQRQKQTHLLSVTSLSPFLPHPGAQVREDVSHDNLLVLTKRISKNKDSEWSKWSRTQIFKERTAPTPHGCERVTNLGKFVLAHHWFFFGFFLHENWCGRCVVGRPGGWSDSVGRNYSLFWESPQGLDRSGSLISSAGSLHFYLIQK